MLRTTTSLSLSLRRLLLLRTSPSLPVRSSLLALLPSGRRPFSSSSSRSDQPSHFSRFKLEPKIAAALEQSSIGHLLQTVPDVKDLVVRFAKVLTRNGYSVMNPPSKLQLGGMLLVDSEFRSALSDSQALLAKHNISLDDVQKLASSLMDVGHRASQTADTVIAQSLPSKDGVQETAKEEIQQASNAAAKVASSVLPLANEPLGADATTPSSTPLEAKPGDGGREEGGVQGFFDKVFGKKQ